MAINFQGYQTWLGKGEIPVENRIDDLIRQRRLGNLTAAQTASLGEVLLEERGIGDEKRSDLEKVVRKAQEQTGLPPE